MTQEGYDSKFDKWTDKIEQIGGKADEDIPPEEKLALYDKVISMYQELLDKCRSIEASDPELYPNSKEAQGYLNDAKHQRDYYFKVEYNAELDDFEERVADGYVPSKYKHWVRPKDVLSSPATPIKGKYSSPSPHREISPAIRKHIMSKTYKQHHSTPPPLESKKAGCLVYFCFILTGLGVTLYLIA